MANSGRDNKPNMKDAALYWAGQGLAIVPCHRPVFDAEGECTGCTCRQPRCRKQGKHPRQATLTRVIGEPEHDRGGYHQATSDVALVAKLWDDTPDANIGIAVGKVSGVIAIDVDPRSNGWASLKRLRADGIELPNTVTNDTGGGGLHALYRYPDVGVDLPHKIEDPRYPGIEILTGPPSGIIAPPSLHRSGRRYRRHDGRSPEDLGIAEGSQSLVEYIRRIVGDAREKDGEVDAAEPTEFSVRPGARAPEAKLAALLAADAKFRRTWEHDRPEFGGDLSRYEQALADAAIAAGWEPQEVVDLLVEFRERRGGEAKPETYYRATLAKATAHVGNKAPAKPTQATHLIEIAKAETKEFFQDAHGVDFARIVTEVGDGRGGRLTVDEVHPLTLESPFRDNLEWRYRDVYGTEPGPGEVIKAIRQLRRESRQGGRRNLQPRATQVDGEIWIDRGDLRRTAYRVGPGRVDLVTDPPALWWRPSNMGEIPEFPTEAASYDLRRVAELVNLPRDSANAGIDLLFLVYLVLGFVPPSAMPHPLLLATGPEGSGKSSMCDIIKWTVDPPHGTFGLDGRVKVRRDQDVQIILYNNAVLHFDNVSRIDQAMADDLSTAVTGVEVAARKLFSDYAQVSLRIRRTIMVTSISHPLRANDLISRTLWFPLPMIDPSGTAHRDGQRGLDEYWRDRPLIVGACLNTLAKALALPEPEMPFVNRFPDWCQLGARIAQVLGRTPDEFSAALRTNMVNHRLQALEGQYFARAVYEMMTGRDRWEGQMRDLVADAQIAAETMGFPTDSREHWPQHLNTASEFLERAAATLAQLGITRQRKIVRGKRVVVLLRTADVNPADDDDDLVTVAED